MPPKIAKPPKPPKPPKIATGTIAEVWEGKAPQTRAGLTRLDLMQTPSGKITTVAAHESREAKKRVKQRDKCNAFAEYERARMAPFNVGEWVRHELPGKHELSGLWVVIDKGRKGYTISRQEKGSPESEIDLGKMRIEFRRIIPQPS